MVRSRYNITRPLGDNKGKHEAGPFDMKELLDTLSKVRHEQTKASDNEISEGAKSSIAGLGTIIAKKDNGSGGKVEKNKKKFNKTIVSPVTVRTLSDIHTTFIDRTHRKEDFDKTLVDIQKKTVAEAFDVMQMIVRTMTGVLPVSI